MFPSLSSLKQQMTKTGIAVWKAETLVFSGKPFDKWLPKITLEERLYADQVCSYRLNRWKIS